MCESLAPADVASAVWRPGDAVEPLRPEEAAALGPVSEQRRGDFTRGRACARRALAMLGLPPTAILIGADRAPLWPDGVVGSIAHTSGCCVAVAASVRSWRAVGVDVEPNAPLPSDVLQDVADERERAELARLPSGAAAWDRVLFCAKESFYKAWRPLTGRWLGFEDVCVDIDADAGSFEAGVAGQESLAIAIECGVASLRGRWCVDREHAFAFVGVRAT